MLEYLNEQVQQHFDTKFTGKEEVKLSDYVIPAYVQVNDADKATAMSKVWNKENVVSFILESEDRTGVITDIDSTIENVGVAEGDLTKYALPIAIMKDLQGKMIDASKVMIIWPSGYTWDYQVKVSEAPTIYVLQNRERK